MYYFTCGVFLSEFDHSSPWSRGTSCEKKTYSHKQNWLALFCSLILCSLVFIHISFTSKAGTVWWIHGNYRVRGPGWAAHTRIVEGSDPKGVGAALNKPSDRKTGILHWSVITLGPMMSAHLQPVKKYLDDEHWCELYGLIADGIWLTCQWSSQWWNCCPPLLAASM